MIADPAPMRRRILWGIIISCLVLVLASALLPNRIQREVQGKQRNLLKLRRVPAPPLSSSAPIRMSWHHGSGEAPGRDVTIHLYATLGKAFPRRDLLQEIYIYGSKGQGQTVFHFRFDPTNPDEVRLATVIAASTANNVNGASALREETLGVGRKLGNKTVDQRVHRLEHIMSQKLLDSARKGVLAEIADGTAISRPPGTVICECGGRFFEVPPPPASRATGFGPYSSELSEAMEAFADARVPLP